MDEKLRVHRKKSRAHLSEDGRRTFCGLQISGWSWSTDQPATLKEFIKDVHPACGSCKRNAKISLKIIELAADLKQDEMVIKVYDRLNQKQTEQVVVKVDDIVIYNFEFQYAYAMVRGTERTYHCKVRYEELVVNDEKTTRYVVQKNLKLAHWAEMISLMPILLIPRSPIC